MSEILFKAPCPAASCHNEELMTWRPSQCPSSSSFYLTDRGFLRCDHCGKEFEFFSRNWKSSSCNHDYQKSNLKKAFQIIHELVIMNNASSSFMKKVCRALMEQAQNYDGI